MAFQQRIAAAAIALVISGGAQASLETGAGASGASNGELFFIAVDSLNRTFVKDLGISYSTLAGNSTSTSWFTSINLGSLVISGTDPGNFNFGDGVKWNLAAGRQKAAAPFTPDNNGVFSTVNAASVTDPNFVEIQPAGVTLNAANTKLNNFRTAVINKAISLNTGAGSSNAFSTSAAADNDAYVYSDLLGPRAFGDAWGDNLNNKSQFKTAGELANGDDSSLLFYHWFLEPTGLPAPNAFHVVSEQQAGVWTLTQTGVLSYGASAVPVPAGVWLLGSALAGLAGLHRRKTDLNDKLA